MKFIKRTLGTLSIFILSSFTLKPAAESFASFIENPKKVLIIGDIHATLAPIESDLGKLDMQDSEIVFSFIKKISKLPCPSKFILENSKSDLAQKENIRKLCGLNDLYYRLPFYAKDNNYSVGSISFCLADSQPNITRNFLEIFTLLDNPDARDPQTFFNMKDQIKLLLGEVGTIKEFFNEIELKIEQLKDTINYNVPDKATPFLKELFKQIIMYKNIGEKSFASGELDTCYVDVFATRFLKTQDLRSLLEPLYSWILPLFENLLDCDLIINLTKTLKRHNQVIIFVGNKHAITLHNFLKSYGFKPEFIRGLTEKSNGPAIFECARFDRGEFSSFLSNAFCLKCASCTQHDNLKRCSRCKSTFYCSQECQKKDWPSHKLICKKK